MKIDQIQTRYNEAFQFLQLRKRRQAEQLKLLSNLRRGDQNISSTLLLTLFDRMLSNVYDDKIQVKFLPSQGITQDQIDAYNTLAISDYQEMDKAKMDYDWIWDTLFFGRGYVETSKFDKKRKLMSPHVINPLVLYYDPYNENPQQWRYYGKWITKNKVDLIRLQQAGILKKGVNINRLKSGIDPYLWQYKVVRDQARDGVPPPIDPIGSDVYQILEHYDYDENGNKCVYWVDKLFSTILYERMLDYEDGEEIIAPDGQTVDTGSRWPIVVKESFRVPHSSLPISVADLLEDKHRAKAVLLNLAFTAAKDQANPLYWYDPDKVRDVSQFLARQVNQHIPVEGDGNQAVGPLNKASSMSQELIEFIRALDEEAEQPIGAGQPAAPAVAGGQRTATQVAISQQLNDVTQSLVGKVLQFGEKEFWSHWFARYAHHGDELKFKMANIVGVNGVDSQTVDLTLFNTDFPPGVWVYSAKEAESKELTKRRDFMELLPVLTQTLDQQGLRNFYKHVFMPLFLDDPSLVEVMFPDSIDEMNAQAENEQLKDGMLPDVKPTDNHVAHIYIHMMQQPKTWATWTHLHWHQELLEQSQSQSGGMGGQQAQGKVAESIGFKDLAGYPEAQQQMAAQAGIQLGAPSGQMAGAGVTAGGGQGGLSTVASQPQTPQNKGQNGKSKSINVGKEKRSPMANASPLKTEITSNNQSQLNG